MDANDFMIEEYRQLYGEIKNYQGSYTGIERLSLAGAGVAYGFLISNQDKVPSWGWWLVPALLGLAFVRCFSYYWIINMKHAPHLTKIERRFYGDSFVGFQDSLTGAKLDRRINVVTSCVLWFLLITTSCVASSVFSHMCHVAPKP